MPRASCRYSRYPLPLSSFLLRASIETYQDKEVFYRKKILNGPTYIISKATIFGSFPTLGRYYTPMFNLHNRFGGSIPSQQSNP